MLHREEMFLERESAVVEFRHLAFIQACRRLHVISESSKFRQREFASD